MKFKRNGLILGKKYNEYLLPTILSSVSILLASFIDGIIVSALNGTDAFSAVNLSEPVVLFMQAVFFIFGIGGAVGISVAKGRRDNKQADTLFSISVVLGIAASVITMILGVVFIDQIVSLICNENSLFPLVKDYVLVTFYGSPLMIFVPLMSFIIRTDGMPKLSANILLISNIVNLLMDLVYIGLFNMGTAGAAIATVTGYFVGLIPVIGYFLSKKRTLNFKRPALSDFKQTGVLCSGGIASATNTVLLFIKAIFINRIVINTGGADAMAVFSVCNFTVSFVSMFISGGSDTMTPILGMLFGEKDYSGMRFIFRKTMRVVLICCGITVAVMLIVPQFPLMLFGVTSSQQLEIGLPAIRIFSISLIGTGIAYVLMNYFQTISQRTISIMITVLRGIALTVPFAFIFSKLFGITGIWTSFVAAEFSTVLITLIVCKIKASTKNSKYSGFLLFEKTPDNEIVYDASLKAQTNSSAEISENLIRLCLENGESDTTSSFVGILVEEMIENIKSFNKNNNELEIDVICRILLNEIILSIRDNGEPLESDITTGAPDDFTNIYMISRIADNVEYSRTLGLNNTVLTIRRTKC